MTGTELLPASVLIPLLPGFCEAAITPPTTLTARVGTTRGLMRLPSETAPVSGVSPASDRNALRDHADVVAQGRLPLSSIANL
jgi:hypothetical protein